MTRQTILVLFGGESSEHEVSISSARNVVRAIDTDKYEAVLGYIAKDGSWWLLDEWTDEPAQKMIRSIQFAPGKNVLLVGDERTELTINLAFPVLHGKNGEDGTVQGLLSLLHIPFVGCGVEASAVCMDKNLTKELLRYAGITVSEWLTLTADVSLDSLFEDKDYQHTVEKELGTMPWFVKPSRSGSSVGVSKVTHFNELRPAIEQAFEHDSTVLIERGIVGRELETAVLGNVPHHEVSNIGEIILTNDFYNYEEKYSDESHTKVSTKAELNEATAVHIREIAHRAYTLLQCRGLARIDFLLDDDNTPYLLEVNTLPGFTDISMYPKLWQESGITYFALVDRLITLALE